MGNAKALLRDETGATAIEYGLLASLLAMTLLGSFLVLSNQVDESFTDVSTKYENALNGSTGGSAPPPAPVPG